MNKDYEDYEEKKTSKFKITRGMLILGVLIVAAIIIIIAIIASNTNKSVKYTTADFTKLENRMEEEAPTYISQKNITLTSDTIKINLADMLEKNGGSINQDKIKAVKVCTGYVIAYKQDSDIYKAYISCGKYYETSGYISNDKNTTTVKSTTKKDVTKPTLTLIGDNPLTLEKGIIFEDPGAKAIDNIDGDITSNIKVSGKVDTSKIGTYVLTYTVTDSSGNKSVITRKIIIKVPTTTAKVTTNAETTKSTSKATTQQQVIVRTTTAQIITTPPTITLYGDSLITINQGTTYNDSGYYASDAIGNNITGKVIVSSNVNINSPGTYYITYKVTDSYGNSTSKTRTIVVKSTYVPVSTISLSPNAFELSVGASRQINFYISPSNATNKTVSWSSSNPAVAVVSGGVVYAKAKGTTIITITSSNGLSSKSQVTVK